MAATVNSIIVECVGGEAIYIPDAGEPLAPEKVDEEFHHIAAATPSRTDILAAATEAPSADHRAGVVVGSFTKHGGR